MKNLSTSIIIPVHNGQDKQILKASLHSILHLKPAPKEVILVTDGKKFPLPELHGISKIVNIETGVQSGPAVARNLGAQHASGDILLFIDSDIVVPPHLAEMVQYEFQKSQKIDALFGSYDTEPHMPDFLSQYRNLLHHYVHQTSSEEAFTFWSGCGAVRKEVFFGVGGFDGERFPEPSIEDIELGYRLIKADYTIRLCKDMQVKHLKKWEAYSMVKVDFFKRALPWTELLLEQNQMSNDMNLKTSNRLSVAIIFLLIASWFLSFWNPYLIIFSSPLIFFFIVLNYDLYRFFYKKKGLWFTLKVIPWHSVFYLLSGLAFSFGLANHYLIRTYGK